MHVTAGDKVREQWQSALLIQIFQILIGLLVRKPCGVPLCKRQVLIYLNYYLIFIFLGLKKKFVSCPAGGQNCGFFCLFFFFVRKK